MGIGVRGGGEGERARVEGIGEAEGIGDRGSGVRESDSSSETGEGLVSGWATNRLPLPGWQAARSSRSMTARREGGVGVNVGWEG